MNNKKIQHAIGKMQRHPVLLLQWIVMMVFLIGAFSCKSPEATAKATSSQKDPLSEKQRNDYTYLFFNANKEKLIGNDELAANLFMQCVKLDPTNPAPMYELAMIHNAQNHREEALFFSKKAAQLDKANAWYQLLYVEVLQKSKKYGEAVKVLQELVKTHPTHIEYYYNLADATIIAGKYEDAIKVYDKIEEITGVNPQVSSQKYKLYSTLNNFNKAEAELKKLIKNFPKESKYYGMLGELYQSKGLNDKAFETYNDLLKIDPSNAYVHLSLADYYRSIKDNEKSYTELKYAFQNANLDIDTKINILLSYYSVTEKYAELKHQALELCEILITVHETDAKSHSMYGDFLYREKKLEKARDEYRRTIELDKSKYPVWNQLLIIESELSDNEAMQKEAKEAMELFPTQPLPYLLSGLASIQQKKYKDAIETLKAGVSFAFDNKPMKAQFYASMGDALHEDKQEKASDEAYDEALSIDPKNAYVLNNYSYYLSLRNENLEKAEQMSKRSLEIEPENESFLDTYAWILYQMKKYSDAKTWMEKALKDESKSSAVLLEHYGDILYQLGEKEKAFGYWNKAKEKGKGSDFLEKKISEKKLYE